jgi:MFS family permease
MGVDTEEAARAVPAAVAYPHRWQAVGVLFFAGFMDLLDVTIVNVALPGIQRDLHSTYASVQWVVAAYLLSYAVVLVPAGRAGDVLGRKTLFILGVAGFTAASAMCGFAVSPGMLIGARVQQGAMAAVMTPQVMSFMQVLFEPHERGPVIGAFGGLAVSRPSSGLSSAACSSMPTCGVCTGGRCSSSTCPSAWSASSRRSGCCPSHGRPAT